MIRQAPALRGSIFPKSTFTRLGVPVVQPPAGILRPQPSRGHSTVSGIWR